MFYAAGLVVSLTYFACCSAKECKDESTFCNITVIDVCSRDETRKYCLKTCNLCDSTSTVTPTKDCSDQWTNCTKLEVDVCRSDPDVARIYCFKTCGKCITPISTTTRSNVATHSDSLLMIISYILFLATTKFMV